MKKIEAFIRHEALEAIHDRLATMGLPSMSVTEVKGSGRQKGFTESYRGAKTTIFLRPKLKLEMVLDDSDVDRAIDTILELAHTGEPGDGKIFVFAVEESIRVQDRGARRRRARPPPRGEPGLAGLLTRVASAAGVPLGGPPAAVRSGPETVGPAPLSARAPRARSGCRRPRRSPPRRRRPGRAPAGG